MEMDEQKIGMVQVRASELRSKIANCIPKTPQTNPILQDDQIEDGDNNTIISNVVKDPSSLEVVDDEEDAETLLNICDAFDSLESQLNALQELQQQQQYERQAVIADIEYSRKMLLKKLGEYKGVHMDVIQEAEAFASMNVEHDNELLLPPYSTRTPPRSLVLDNSHLSRSSYNRKLAQNGYNGNETTNESKNSHSQSSASRLWGGLRFLVHSTAKTMVTLVGVISLLRLAGFEPRLSKKGADLKILSLIQPGMEEKRLTADCPPGKVAVMEDGEIHFIVKERIEIPFDSVAGNPDVNYGCG